MRGFSLASGRWKRGFLILLDKFGRVHDYLRISVTDRCNLCCRYCMPAEGLEFLPNERVLSFDEIEEVVRVAAKQGVRRLRITGGEPLVRPHLEDLIRKLLKIAGIEDIALTTNAIYLASRAAALKEAGITRVNISLDSLLRERFSQITRGGDLARVLDALERSYEVGFDRWKSCTSAVSPTAGPRRRSRTPSQAMAPRTISASKGRWARSG
jgi:GTP 3',8-cyclase